MTKHGYVTQDDIFIKPLVFTVAGVAAYLACSESHIRAEIRAGKLPAKSVGSKVLILRTDADGYLYNQPNWTPGKAPKSAIKARRKTQNGSDQKTS